VGCFFSIGRFVGMFVCLFVCVCSSVNTKTLEPFEVSS